MLPTGLNITSARLFDGALFQTVANSPNHSSTCSGDTLGRRVVSLDRKCLGRIPAAELFRRSCCPEAFSIRRLEGRRWQWRALIWSYDRQLACMDMARTPQPPGIAPLKPPGRIESRKSAATGVSFRIFTPFASVEALRRRGQRQSTASSPFIPSKFSLPAWVPARSILCASNPKWE